MNKAIVSINEGLHEAFDNAPCGIAHTSLDGTFFTGQHTPVRDVVIFQR